MTLLQHAAEPWLRWITSASWQLGLLIGIVTLLAWAARGASPRLRHALWMLVLVKVFLPPGLSAPWSLGRFVAVPLAGLADARSPSPPWRSGSSPRAADDQAGTPGTEKGRTPSPATLLMIAWAAGCAGFLAVVGWRYGRLARAIRSMPTIDEGPVRVALEQLAVDLGLARVPDLCSAPLVTSPFLFGVFRPFIVLPEKSLTELRERELHAVLAHELVHFRHRDTWIGWLQVLSQTLFWFHPLVWWANAQLRQERELVCDEAVLHLAHFTPDQYGESIVRVLTASRGRSLMAASLVGVFERGTQLQERLERIMNYESRAHRFGWLSRLAVAAVAILLLPMAPGALHSAPADTPYPQIASTSPAVGARGVDPGLREITVTFDRDMNEQGMSWTGGGDEFPKIDESRKAAWKDARTCLLPVKLEKGTFYRVGINSTSFRNFQSSDGTPALPSVIYFTTQGATAEVESKLRVPQIVSLEPKNGASDVDPATEAIRVTFDVAMGGGMSWTGARPQFPETPQDKKASWSKDGLTCTLPVTLEPARDYQLGINSPSHTNFQSQSGVPLAPVVYRFRTADKK